MFLFYFVFVFLFFIGRITHLQPVFISFEEYLLLWVRFSYRLVDVYYKESCMSSVRWNKICICRACLHVVKLMLAATKNPECLQFVGRMSAAVDPVFLSVSWCLPQRILHVFSSLEECLPLWTLSSCRSLDVCHRESCMSSFRWKNICFCGSYLPTNG